MTETPQQYTARLLALVADGEPFDVFRATPARLQALVNGAPREALVWTTAPERWSIAQIAAHLADAEIVGAWRLRAVLAEDGVPLQPFDQNVWASAFTYEEVDAGESVALFSALRSATVRLLGRVDPARLQHAGLHAERGRESGEHLIRLYAGHDLNHLTQIERLLGEYAAASRPAPG
jgi:hypothetical protein